MRWTLTTLPTWATLLAACWLGTLLIVAATEAAADDPPAAEEQEEPAEFVPPTDDADPAEDDEAPADPDGAADENAGQKDLAKAIDTRINADSLDELGRAILLCETALLKGLDKDNTIFAKQLLGSARLERATKVSSLILDTQRPNPQWQQLRQIALTDLEKATESQPEMAEAYLLTARLQALPGGDDEAALAAAEQAVKHADPDDRQFQSQALMVRGDLQKEQQKQLADYDAALKALPANVDALRSRGLHFLATEKFKQAQDDFEAALKIDADDARTLEALGVVLFMNDQREEAEKRLSEAIEIAPDSPLAYSYRARVYAVDDKLDKALADADAALDLAPNSPSLLLLRSQIHNRAGNDKKAMADVDALLEQQPELPEAILMKALLLASAGNLEDGAAYLKTAIEKQPDNLELKSQLAAFYLSEKQTDEAIQVYTEILEKVPDDVSSLRGRGDAYLGIGKLEEAIADYEAALKIDPDNSGVLNNLAWLLATSPDEEIRQGERAVKLANKAGEVTDHKQAHILSTMAAAYAEAGDWDKAVEWSVKAYEKGEGEIKSQLERERDAFKNKKPWREINHPDGTRSSGPEGDLQRE